MDEIFPFQRARRPEQQLLRRKAILDAAQELLAERPAQDISLREIARRLGGSKSGIVRYYETREAVFLELLQRARQEWLDELEDRLPPPSHPDVVSQVADVWATSLAERPMLCELWSVLAAVLERNVSPAVIREFKLGNRQQLLRLAEMIASRVPGLDSEAAIELVNTSVVVIVGLWPFANPGPAVREAIDDPRLTSSHVDFAQTFSRDVRVLITGLLTIRN
ncbi:TetR family transcriptional regulator [Kibdelosporangium philippinense]|uniref:TetR family transcriptional regulator n=1 Tax=Kibdelosporangium philippinense TaxID=211113 RepID=A0ABS8ZRI5_9PSEU|nr:TetR family transcriptional regulator [Kibdelosporangium philippinense]MCE7010262.1 TetR family transcriptional regulator [Kibdelosporangium philippinense]